ncbi:helix-turn-helix domain-containing protein [Kitasatospora sp. NPDC101235]|uniref:helix-turn-helix domain-containing protein n=1 Tax=Kitasatospora sp. NPDC101235 TaxID=3364101 RepID=UPI003816EB30
MPTPKYRFDIAAFREAAAQKGDATGYAIAQRTGLSEGAISRILNGYRQPKLDSAAHLAHTYGATLDDLVQVAA